MHSLRRGRPGTAPVPAGRVGDLSSAPAGDLYGFLHIQLADTIWPCRALAWPMAAIASREAG